MLAIDVRHRRGDFRLEARLDVAVGKVTALVGESGAGKTTLLRIVAGLIAPDAGHIMLGDRMLFDRAHGIDVPPQARAIGYVAQDHALFPHLSVRRNVAFGLEAQRMARGEVHTRVGAALDRFGIGSLAERRPHQLSGGQQQRVALARALVLDPEVLLLDEPLAALDVASRRGVRQELQRTLAGLPCATLIVTHHPTDALALGERIAVLEAGRLTQSGPRDDFLHAPRSRYVAEFLGVNLLEGEVITRGTDGLVRVGVGGGVITVPDPGHTGPMRLVLHPHEISLSLVPPSGSARNVLRGRIEEIIPEPPDGERVRVLLSTTPALAAQVTRSAIEQLALARGSEVYAAFKATGLTEVP